MLVDREDEGFTVISLINILSGKFLLGRSIFVGMFNIAALILSWILNKSILWAIFHFFFGFWYFVYQGIINLI